jgi:formiminoglutamase
MDPFSECKAWTNVASLFRATAPADIAFIGAPQAEKSLTPGRCDLAPSALRAAAKRFSVYDVETGTDLSHLRVRDAGDLPLKLLTPEESLPHIRDALRGASEPFAILCGGNNAVTRPGVHGLGADLKRIGLVTLDAHFDLRDTDCGLTNGNPIRALLEDGMPGANIVQIGIAPFANSRRMHETAKAAGIRVFTASDCAEHGAPALLNRELSSLRHLDAIFIDFDIDVIDRSQMPAAPGARPGGISARDFFACARIAGRDPKVRAVDLTEFDPALDQAEIGALTAGRWLCEILAGFAMRGAA